jgi:hypothetical protein
MSHLIEVGVGIETEKSANEVFARHDLLAFDLDRCIFVEDFAELFARRSLEIGWTLKSGTSERLISVTSLEASTFSFSSSIFALIFIFWRKAASHLTVQSTLNRVRWMPRQRRRGKATSSLSARKYIFPCVPACFEWRIVTRCKVAASH